MRTRKRNHPESSCFTVRRWNSAHTPGLGRWARGTDTRRGSRLAWPVQRLPAEAAGAGGLCHQSRARLQPASMDVLKGPRTQSRSAQGGLRLPLALVRPFVFRVMSDTGRTSHRMAHRGLGARPAPGVAHLHVCRPPRGLRVLRGLHECYLSRGDWGCSPGAQAVPFPRCCLVPARGGWAGTASCSPVRRAVSLPSLSPSLGTVGPVGSVCPICPAGASAGRECPVPSVLVGLAGCLAVPVGPVPAHIVPGPLQPPRLGGLQASPPCGCDTCDLGVGQNSPCC